MAVLLCATPVKSQTAQPASSATAHATFQAGVTQAASGELEAALRSFETAYAQQPHYSVLYNIGQAQSALGRPLDATRTFERYLLEAGVKLSTARREEVQQLLAANRRRLGALHIVGMTETTRVWLDGVELRSDSLAEPIPVSVGPHRLLHSDGSGFPVSEDVTIVAGATADLKLEPQPPLKPQAPPAEAQLAVSCPIPGVAVEIAGVLRATTPITEPLVVSAGEVTVRFHRLGYVPTTKRVFVSDNTRTAVACEQRLEARIQRGHQATLRVRATPEDAQIFINGTRFLGTPLPGGAHDLAVRRDGFLERREPISLAPGKVATYTIDLQPTPARYERERRAANDRKQLGFFVGGGGGALVLGGVALFVWNGGRYHEWQRANRSNTFDLGGVASIQRVDDLALACSFVGTGLLAAGGWLLFTKPTLRD